MHRRLAAAILVLVATTVAATARAQSAANGEALYRAYCATCHAAPVGSAADPSSIRTAINYVADMRFLSFLSDPQVADIAAWIALVVGPPVAPPPNYTGLWYNAPAESESGWGINFTQQGDTLFATLFTYDADRSPMWLVMSGGQRQGTTSTFSGPLYRTTGPPFNATPFTPIGAANLTEVGAMSVAFQADGSAQLTYSVNGAAVSKRIIRQVFGSRPASCSNTHLLSRASLTNYQDLWWNPSEPGWGVNLTHQDQTLFATLFTYNAANRGVWLVMSAGVKQADGSFSGALYQTTGPPFNAVPFTPIGAGNVTQVGTMRLVFATGEVGTLSYTYNGITVTKAITRQVFAPTLFRCD